MNWGYRIAIFLTLFIGFIMFLVIKAHKKEIDLVSKDYYQQELAFQEVINAKSNAAKYLDSVTIKFQENYFELWFPKELIHSNIGSGKIHFYNAQNSKQDKIFDLFLTSDGVQRFSYQDFQAKRYKVKIVFSKDEKNYQIEKNLTL